MKILKLIIPVLSMVSLLLLGGCSSNMTTEASDDGLSVITTIFPPYDFVREISDSKISVQMLLPPGAESHSFEPTSQDIIAIGECDLFIYVGGESDAWVDEMLNSLGNNAPETLTLMECVEPVVEELVEGMEYHEDEDEEEFDEHVWASPKNAMLICDKITEKLAALDPAGAAVYTSGNASYQKELTKLDSLFDEIMDSAARNTIVIGDRFPFRYLTEAYGIEYYAAFPGCSTESEPSAATIAFLIDKVKEEDLPVVFYIEFSNHKVADAISEATGAETLLMHSCHSVTAEQLENGESYISIMTQNAENLRKALN